MSAAYRRVLLKLSGEALMGDDAFGINRATIERMVADIADVQRMGVELAIVIGGGDDALAKDIAMHIAASKPKALRA
ncbi:MAG TPA: hypothetical protein VF229_07765, partial [Burkholderiaceae bacterium]